MTKKYFIEAAQRTASINDPVTRHSTAHTLAAQFATMNPRFKRGTFLAACKVTEAPPHPAPRPASLIKLKLKGAQ